MKYGVITFHRAENFGAILQTLALQMALDKSGIDNEVIDYRCQFIENHYSHFKVWDAFKIRKIANIIIGNSFSKNNKRNFQEFSKKYIKISDIIYKTKTELINANYNYDGVITGSDQVWNYICAGFDKSYFLDFITDNKKKMSYGASFGVDKIPDIYINDYKTLLNGFNKISVREEQGKKIINKLINTNVTVVLDPTLLLSVDEWTQFMNPIKYKEDYVLIYLIAETKSIFDFAKKLAKEKDLKIIYINDKFYKKYGMNNVSCINPSDWLTLFYNAKYIVTNSFHGLAFSINFKKDFFVELLPEPAKVNSRLKNILDIFNLNNRLIDNSDYILEGIDYTDINNKLKKERNNSFNYIESLKNFR